jgi:Cellulase (glycosyl hydrolase family 5)
MYRHWHILAIGVWAPLAAFACGVAFLGEGSLFSTPSRSQSNLAVDVSPGDQHEESASTGPSIETSKDGLSVAGNSLMVGGKPFSVKGVQIVGRLTPDEYMNTVNPNYKEANQRFGPTVLSSAKSFGANVIRFQVSQVGIDPQAHQPIDHERYKKKITDAVALALDSGFKVIVSLQHQRGSAASYDQPLPGQNTVRAWQVLAPIWKDDSRVIYELYNEPAIAATDKKDQPRKENWDLWLRGGPWVKNRKMKNQNDDNPSGIVVGILKVIQSIRETGAKNLLIVPGLSTQKSFKGVPMPLPSDPQGNLAYGVHSPYLGGGADRWDEDFGFLSGQVPVIVTEWAAASNHRHCEPNYPREAPEFLRYLKSHDIGINAFAFDLVGTLIRDWNYTPTSYSLFQCGKEGGPGQLLQSYYTTGEIR